MELREKIARVLREEHQSSIGRGDYGVAAERIIAIPEIAGALAQAYGEGELAKHLRSASLLGPSISTNRRDPV